MCYHLSFSSDIASIYELLPDLDTTSLDIPFHPTYHMVGQAYPKWPVVTSEGGRLQLKQFEWGVIAPYMKAENLRKERNWMLNIRSERVLGDRNSYWHRIRQNRCLVPATGFYEFRDVGWKKKVPYYIRLKHRPVFLLPGLFNYSHVPNVHGELPGTFAILIRNANEVMRKIHNSGDNPFRMPLMLPPELEKEWLNPALTDLDLQRIISYEMPPDALEYWPVKSLYRTDPYSEAVMAPEMYEGLPAL
ncbi:SOS response-associated peptidase [Chitinophaga japonensis]|uniref:Abasic site processing protein n=1 Tax=Chitinophaga japonensis TaxID=104662 RepID=A0A562TEY4_CHIJA|nr:SOS response-associated peptidase family protein [Chitinophaga japonensis]TWI92045.1 putative SOS response-associated peptidase YedK [Chitinophaga japonensis]